MVHKPSLFPSAAESTTQNSCFVKCHYLLGDICFVTISFAISALWSVTISFLISALLQTLPVPLCPPMFCDAERCSIMCKFVCFLFLVQSFGGWAAKQLTCRKPSCSVSATSMTCRWLWTCLTCFLLLSQLLTSFLHSTLRFRCMHLSVETITQRTTISQCGECHPHQHESPPALFGLRVLRVVRGSPLFQSPVLDQWSGGTTNPLICHLMRLEPWHGRTAPHHAYPLCVWFTPCSENT